MTLDPVENNWAEGADGYYYYTLLVSPKTGAEGENPDINKTGVLITSCTVAEDANVPPGYSLSVEIVASSIQADGEDKDGNKPVELAWSNDKVDVSVGENGVLTIETKPQEEGGTEG